MSSSSQRSPRGLIEQHQLVHDQLRGGTCQGYLVKVNRKENRFLEVVAQRQGACDFKITHLIKDEETELKEQSVDEEIEPMKKHRAYLAESHRIVKEKQMKEEAERERKLKEELEGLLIAQLETCIDEKTEERGLYLTY